MHEFAHCLMDFGLPPNLRDAIEARWAASVKEQGLWQRPDGTPAYAALNAQEYFAELSMWIFGTHGEFVDGEAQQPAPGPFGLQRYDPAGFELVGSIYSATHPMLQDVPPPPERLYPAASDARSRPEPDGGGSGGGSGGNDGGGGGGASVLLLGGCAPILGTASTSAAATPLWVGGAAP